MTLEPAMAKVHSGAQADRFTALGWRLGVEIKAGNGETYEWVLHWDHTSPPSKTAASKLKAQLMA
jgi:hypothetical protein